MGVVHENGLARTTDRGRLRQSLVIDGDAARTRTPQLVDDGLEITIQHSVERARLGVRRVVDGHHEPRTAQLGDPTHRAQVAQQQRLGGAVVQRQNVALQGLHHRRLIGHLRLLRINSIGEGHDARDELATRPLPLVD